MQHDEKIVLKKELIAAERVMELWSVSDSELIEEIKRGNITLLFCSKKPRQSPTGEILLVCWEGTYKNVYYHNDFPNNEDTYYDFSDVFLYAIDITGHQIQFPHLTLPTTDIKSDTDKTIQVNSIQSTDPEWMPAHEARVVIGMTPINFVNFLNSGRLETDREQERLDFAKNDGWEIDNVPFFKTNDLDTLRVHKASFADYTEEIYAGRHMNTSILKYYGSKDDTAYREDVDNNKNTDTPEATTPDSFLTADDLCKRWSISPTQLVNIIRNHKDLPVYWEESDVPF